MTSFLRTNPRSQDKRGVARSDPQAGVLWPRSFGRSSVLLCNYPFAINVTDFSPPSPVIALGSQISSTLPFTMTSPSKSYFVAVNPNTDTLNAVPLAEGSPDLLFAVFGRGSSTDVNALLVHAQESLNSTCITDCRRTWIVLHSDGTVEEFFGDTS